MTSNNNNGSGNSNSESGGGNDSSSGSKASTSSSNPSTNRPSPSEITGKQFRVYRKDTADFSERDRVTARFNRDE